MKAVHAKVALALTMTVGSLGLFGAAALGAFGPETSSTVVSSIDPVATAVLGEDKTDRLKKLLDGLVLKGVITQQQEEAILAAVKDAKPDLHKARVLRDLFGESAAYLGIPEKDLRAKLPGTSLGKIADSMPPKSKAGLVAALTKAANEDIDKALAAKKITDEQAKKLRDGLAKEITTFVERTWPVKPTAVSPRAHEPSVRSYLGEVMQAARDYLGVTLQDVSTWMRSGKSLGELATDKGKTRDGLVSVLVTAANKRIDQAVLDKKLTPEQAAALKQKVITEIGTFVDRKWPANSNTTTGTTPKKP